MTFCRLWLAALSLLAVAACQSNTTPELKIRVLTDKDNFVINEEVIARVQLTNETGKTLCFPRPATNEQVAVSGWIEMKAERANGSEHDEFIKVFDGRGKSGKELEKAVKNDWIKLKPGETYLASPFKTLGHLDEPGEWRLTATYHPAEGSFSREYRKSLQKAAQKNGCTLPIVAAQSESVVISVSKRD